MTIGFDGSRAFSKDRTGTENYSYQLLKALSQIDRKNKYKIYTRITLYATAVVKSVNWPGNFEFKEIHWSRLWTQGGLALQTFKDDLDVLFVPAHTLPLVRKPGLKTVVTVHDLGSEYLPAMHQLKQVLYLKMMTHFQLKSATKIIAVSKTTRDDLVRKVGIDPKEIEVIYEGYDKQSFSAHKNKFKVPSSKLKVDTLVNSLSNYFLFVGTIQPRKNLERVILAFYKIYKNYNNYKLVIAGSKGWLSDSIYSLPKELGIEDRVKFLGYVSEKDLAALYSRAIALLFPSLFEGFGLPILEAQACGCPVITSNISSMPEVAGKGAVLVNPYEVEDIIRAMERVQGTGYRVQLIKKGFDNVKRFSWEKCARETLKVLEAV